MLVDDECLTVGQKLIIGSITTWSPSSLNEGWSCLSQEGKSLTFPPPSPPPAFTIVQSLGAQRLATLQDPLVQAPPSAPDCHSVGPDGWDGDLRLQHLAMAPLAGTTAEMAVPPVYHNPSETLSAPETGEGLF